MTPPPPAAPATTRRRSPPNRRRSPPTRHKSLIDVVQTVQPLENAIASLPTRNWSAFAATSKAARAIDPVRVDEAFRHRNTPVMKAMLERMVAFSRVLVPEVQKAARGLMHTYLLDADGPDHALPFHNWDGPYMDEADRLDFMDRFKTFAGRMAASVRPQKGMNISFGYFDRGSDPSPEYVDPAKIVMNDVFHIMSEDPDRNALLCVIVEMKHTVQTRTYTLYYSVPVAHKHDAPLSMSFPDVSRFDSTGRNWYEQSDVAFIMEDEHGQTEGSKSPGETVWEATHTDTRRVYRTRHDEIEGAVNVLVFASAFRAVFGVVLPIDPALGWGLHAAVQTLLRKSAYYGKTLQLI